MDLLVADSPGLTSAPYGDPPSPSDTCDNCHSVIIESSLGTGELTREQLIQKLLKQSYYFEEGEKGFRLIERHTTSAFFAWQDMLKSRQDFKMEKLITAVDYPIATEDFEVLNEISLIRKPEYRKEAHILLALYLYLADEVTIYPNGLTFLEACRNAKFLDKSDSRSGEEKFIDALTRLGLYDKPHIKNLVTQWRDKGSFMAEISSANIPRDNFIGNNYMGVYSVLAVTLSDKFSPLMRLQNGISYALAVKTLAEKIEDPAKRKQFVFDHAISCSEKLARADRYVAAGHAIRFKKLEDAIKTEYLDTPKPDQERLLRLKRDNEFFTKLFESLSTESNETLQILYYSRYSVAFTEDKNLRNIYPEGHIPGLDDMNTEKSRDGRGDHLSRYRMIMFAQDPQALIHETWHLIAGANCADNHHHRFAGFKKRKDALTKQCYGACEDVLNTKHPILQTRVESYGGTIETILDCVKRYAGYNSPSERSEEVLANIMGLIHTEFRKSRTENNPFFPGDNPITELQPLYDLVEKAQTLYRDAAPLLKENFHRRLEYLRLSRFPQTSPNVAA